MEFLKEPHIRAKIMRIEPYRALFTRLIEEIESREADYLGKARYRFNTPWQPFEKGGKWRVDDTLSRFFRFRAVIPPEYAGLPVYLTLSCGGEALVRVDGEIRCGLCERRSRVWLTDAAEAGRRYEVEIEAGANCASLSGERRAEYSFAAPLLCVPDPDAEAAWFDFLLAWDILCAADGNYFRINGRFMGDVAREYYRLIKDLQSDPTIHDKYFTALTEALKLLDLEGGEEAARQSIKDAAALLRSRLSEVRWHSPVTIALTGCSHIDVAWLWTLDETVRKCGRTFSNVLDLMERYSEHIFSQSQPCLYDYTKAHYPELFEKIRARVAEGRWELVGNPWVECDTNVPSGEALVRQFLYGRAFYLREFGRCSNIFWMPDVFGYSYAIPQIMKRSGVDFFITTKLICNDTNTFPYTYFNWQGVDGTRVFAHLSRENYNGYPEPWYAHYLWEHNTQKGDFNQVIMTYGFGDGGGGPTAEMLEYARRIGSAPGMYNYEHKSAKRFFEEVSADARDLPVWNDEMYFEMHRGTYTTQANNKKNNRRCELLYRAAEILGCAAAALADGGAGSDTLYEGWKIILTNQFHDILPGSSINEVYKVSGRDYAEALRIGTQARDRALRTLCSRLTPVGDGLNFAVYNLLSWRRDDVVTFDTGLPAEALRGRVLRAPDGVLVPFSSDGSVISFTARNLPPMGLRVYALVPGTAEVVDSPVCADGLMENRFFRLTLGEHGELLSVYDKLRGAELLTGRGNILRLFQDNPNAWDIQRDYMDKWYDVPLTGCEITEQTPDRAVLRTRGVFNRSSFTQDIVLYRDLPRIDFVTHADWQERNLLLKAVFPVNVSSPQASYEIAYGTITRPTHENTSWDRAKFEVPMHKWADLSDAGMGVALLNDCKYGCDIHGSTMRISLLRGTGGPDPEADLGQHDFCYSLYAHDGGWSRGRCVQAGYELNVRAGAVPLPEGEKTLPSEFSLCETDRENAVIDALKPAEDGRGFILRVYESGNIPCRVRLSSLLCTGRVFETNLMEQDERELQVTDGGFTFDIRPFEIKTFRLAD